MPIAVQILGIIAFCVAFISFQQKNQKTIAFLQFVSSALFILHYFALGAMVGFWLNIVGALRGLIFSQREKHEWARSIVWPVVLMIMCIVICALNAKSFLDVLPVIGMFFSTIALRCAEAKTVRRLSLFSVPCWLTYNILSGSLGGALTEIFNALSIVTAMIRLDRNSARP